MLSCKIPVHSQVGLPLTWLCPTGIVPGQGATQGPEGKAPFILYSLSLLKGSRAIKKTHRCDEFPWLSAAAGWGSWCDEWSGKENEGRRTDGKENEKEKSRRESGIKNSQEKTRGGLLSGCRLYFLPRCCGRGFLALQSTLQPL